MWRGGLPHRPGVPHLNVKRPLDNPEHEYRRDAASTDVRSGQEPLIVFVCSCHVYAFHRSIVAQVVPKQGHVANPTC